MIQQKVLQFASDLNSPKIGFKLGRPDMIIASCLERGERLRYACRGTFFVSNNASFVFPGWLVVATRVCCDRVGGCFSLCIFGILRVRLRLHVF